MRIAVVILFGWLALNASMDLAATEDEATKAEEEGRWGEAITLWRSLADDGGPREKANHLRVLAVAGRYRELTTRARTVVTQHPGWDVPVIYLSRSLVHQGEILQALEILDPILKRSLAARAEAARLETVLGHRDLADTLMAAIRDGYNRKLNRSPQDHVAAGEAARFQGEFEIAARLFETAYRDSAGFLDARLRLGYLFREKYQANLASEEVVAATRLAPNHPDVHLARAWLALQNTQMALAEEEARRVLGVRGQDPQARSILAMLALIADDPDEALEWIEKVSKTRPFDLGLRAKRTAAEYLRGDPAAFEREADAILRVDPAYSEVFLDLAWILEKSRRNEEAFALYDRVLAADPDHAGAMIAKGLLSMREGWEEEARGYLERGFVRDPFNIRAYNQLELLDKMDTFASYTTEHFELRMEAAKDSLLVPVLMDRLESIYDELTVLHLWEPKRPTLVEVFPSHDWFSARVTGFPVLGGIPAVCFGDVIAMDSPRTLGGQSNWEDILRHEFGHVLALGMTDKKVPFWFTEGLSVHLEHFPRGPRWDANLVGAYLDGGLVSLDSLTIAFTRPRNHGQRLLAYHEASLIIGDLVDRKGWESIPTLLRAFGRGMTFADALEEVGENYADFRDRAMKVVRDEAASLKQWPAPNPERLVRLNRRAESTHDRKFLELLALTRLQFQQVEEAADAAKKLLELDPDNPRGHGVLGLADQMAKKPDRAVERLTRAVALGSEDVPVYLSLSELQAARGDTTAAIQSLNRALDVYPRAAEALRRRGEFHEALGQELLAREDYKALIRSEGAAGKEALRLARLFLAVEQGPAALDALDYAVGVLPLDAEVTALQGRAFLLLDRDREGYDLFQRARRLDLRCVEAMVGMALYYLKHEDFEEAIYFAELAVKYAPDHPDALRVLTLAGSQ